MAFSLELRGALLPEQDLLDGSRQFTVEAAGEDGSAAEITFRTEFLQSAVEEADVNLRTAGGLELSAVARSGSFTIEDSDDGDEATTYRLSLCCDVGGGDGGPATAPGVLQIEALLRDPNQSSEDWPGSGVGSVTLTYQEHTEQ